MLGKEWDRYIELMSERPEEFRDSGTIHIVTDENIVADFEKKNNRKIGVIYESAFNILVVDLVYIQKGKYFAYERMMPKVQNGAVVIVPVYKGRFILLKQYRHALRDYQYAFPRGFGENDISVEQNVKKELYEEMGAKAVDFLFLGTVVADSGASGNKVSIYKCNIKEYDQSIKEEAIVKMIELNDSEIQDMIIQGKITDGFTLSSYCYYQLCD